MRKKKCFETLKYLVCDHSVYCSRKWILIHGWEWKFPIQTPKKFKFEILHKVCLHSWVFVWFPCCPCVYVAPELLRVWSVYGFNRWLGKLQPSWFYHQTTWNLLRFLWGWSVCRNSMLEFILLHSISSFLEWEQNKQKHDINFLFMKFQVMCSLCCFIHLRCLLFFLRQGLAM